MRLSCLPVSLFGDFAEGKLDIVSWAEQAKAIGFDGFDISTMHIKNHTPTYLSTVKEGIAKTGIPLVMVATYPDFTHPDPIQREREHAYIRCDMAASAELGAKFLRVLAGQAHPEIQRQEGIDLAIHGLSKAAVRADKYSIQLVYENHAKPGAWDYIDFSFPPDIFLEVFRGIKDSPVMINFDCGNATAVAEEEGDEVKLLAAVIDKVATLHVCDMKQRGAFSPTLVGTGVTPLADLFSYANDHGFDGWFCIEEAGNLGMDGVRKAHDYVRETWAKACSGKR